MLHRRLVTTLAASFAVALIAAAGLAGSASSAAADGFYFGYNDGPRMPPPPRWGWGPPHRPAPGWGAPGWGPPRGDWGPPPMCRPRWVERPIVDPGGRVVRYQQYQVMDCGPRHHRW